MASSNSSKGHDQRESIGVKPFWLIGAPSDWTAIIILLVVTLTLSVALIGNGALFGQWLLHAGMLVGFCLLCFMMDRREGAPWVPYCRGFSVFAVMFALYSTLGHVAFDAIPWLADGALAELDRRLFLGISPSLWMEPRISFLKLEICSFFYAVFIPYLYLSILLGCFGRPAEERSVFTTGWALTYGISFLGYLFVPARGPIVQMTSQFAGPLDGGLFHGLIVDAVNAAGGPHGAFPSLHVGASLYLCLFDLRYNLLRGLIYLPVVVLIAIATIVVRYHYVVDLAAGGLIALFAIWIAPRWHAWWLSRRPATQRVTPAAELQR